MITPTQPEPFKPTKPQITKSVLKPQKKINKIKKPKKKVKKTFTAHANLIYQVMTRQAGTLGKAILEGVINSIDAQATKMEITVLSNLQKSKV